MVASVGSYAAGLTPTIVNVERINVNGDYASTGLALTNVVGASTLSVNTGILGGSATVIDIAATKAKAVASGANVGTLTVTALGAGTGTNVAVDASNADTVTVNGLTSNDTFTVTAKRNATVSLTDTGGSGDNFTLCKIKRWPLLPHRMQHC